MSNSYNGMRHLILMMMSCLMALLTGCTSGFLQEPVLEKGEVRIFLDQDASEGEVRTKADLALPDVADFEVEIYDIQGNRRYRDTYGNSADRNISLNAGTHRLLAQYGDSTGVGFNSIYYVADQQFEVKGQEVTPIHAVARIGKVKVAVEFGESITTIYKDWYAQVRTAEDKVLRFSKDEMRSGYFPAGSLVLEVYVQEAGQWKRYAAKPMDCKAGEFVQLMLNTSFSKGNLVLTIKIDDSVETVDKTIEIPSDMAPKTPPVIDMKGFSTSLTKLYGGDVLTADFRADIRAQAGISSCCLEMTASGLGEIPAKVELTEAAPQGAEVLENMGISWLKDMSGKHLSYVSFSGLSDWLSRNFAYVPDVVKSLDLKLTVTDQAGRPVTTETYRFEGAKAVLDQDLVLNEADYWARHIEVPAAHALEGNPSEFFIQYKKEGAAAYTDIVPQVQEGNLLFYDLSGLEPSTPYTVRQIYNHNEHLASQEYTFTTENALQIANAGFEDWTDNVYNYSYLGGSASIGWSTPWTSQGEKWWAVNSMKTMNVSRPSAWNQTYKVFPTVGYTSASAASGKSVQVASIAVAGWAIPGTGGYATTPGELWTGTADDNGNHTSDGHAFASRPSQLSYWVLNRPVQGESTRVLLEVRAADGTVIGKAEKVDNKVDQNGRKEILDIVYTDKTKKAASIFISIKSSTAGAPAYSDTTIEFAGTTYNVHAGSKINVDDIRLIY